MPGANVGGALLIKGNLLATVILDKLQPLRNALSMAHELIHSWCHPDGVYHESGASKRL